MTTLKWEAYIDNDTGQTYQVAIATTDEQIAEASKMFTGTPNYRPLVVFDEGSKSSFRYSYGPVDFLNKEFTPVHPDLPEIIHEVDGDLVCRRSQVRFLPDDEWETVSGYGHVSKPSQYPAVDGMEYWVTVQRIAPPKTEEVKWHEAYGRYYADGSRYGKHIAYVGKDVVYGPWVSIGHKPGSDLERVRGETVTVLAR